MPKKVVRFEAEGSFSHRELVDLVSRLNEVAHSVSHRREVERVEVSVENDYSSALAPRLRIQNHDDERPARAARPEER